MLKIAITGAGGRMGRNLIRATLAAEDAQLVAALEMPGSTLLGADAGGLIGEASAGVAISEDVVAAAKAADVLIDFTRPEGTLTALAACQQHGCHMVIGTTGFSAEQRQRLADAAVQLPMVLASNFSVGVNLLFKLAEMAARVTGATADIEILEMHHRHKVDAPSGTALRLGEVIAEAVERRLEDVAVYGREGVTGERSHNEIGFATLRGGDVIGDHTAIFADAGERVEVSHKASDRMIYANGALRACRWLSEQNKAGLFDMQEVLGLQG